MEERLVFQHRPCPWSTSSHSADFNLPLCGQRGWRCPVGLTPLQHTTWLEVKCWTPGQAVKPITAGRTGELEWAGDHRQRTIPPVVRRPRRSSWSGEHPSLHQASSYVPLLTHTPGVGALLSTLFYMWGTVAQR